MTVSVVIPWRTDHGWRERLFTWVHRQWQATGLEVCVGVDDDGGPINVSRALNRARAQATGDVLVVASADHVPDPDAAQAAAQVLTDAWWVPVFTSTAGISRQATLDLIEDRPVDVNRHITAQAEVCTALLAVRADAWDTVGGYDERFHGWGCEDVAFRAVLETLHPDPPVLPRRRTVALWHEAASRDRFEANCELLAPYVAAAGDPAAMRAVLAGSR